MEKLELATSILGLLSQGIGAAVSAIKAATAADEEAAFAILFGVIDKTALLVTPLRAKIAANKLAAEQAIAARFDGGG